MGIIVCYTVCETFLVCHQSCIEFIKFDEVYNKVIRVDINFQNRILGPVWYIYLNTCFQFLNNITHIFIHFFTYTYFHT